MEALRQEFAAQLGEGLTLRPLGEEDLPQVLELYQGNTFYNSVALDRQPDLALCREDLEALPPGKTREEKLFFRGLPPGEAGRRGGSDRGLPPRRHTLYLGLLEASAWGTGARAWARGFWMGWRRRGEPPGFPS